MKSLGIEIEKEQGFKWFLGKWIIIWLMSINNMRKERKKGSFLDTTILEDC